MTEAQFRRRVPDEETARQFLEDLRWRGKPVCPACRGDAVSRCSGHHVGFLRCNTCDVRFNAQTGTIMQHSLMPLDRWLLAAVLLSEGPLTIDQMTERLGVARMTAFGTMKRVRLACGEAGGEDLSTLAQRLLDCPHQMLPPSEKRRRGKRRRRRPKQAGATYMVSYADGHAGVLKARSNVDAVEAASAQGHGGIADFRIVVKDRKRKK